MPLVCDLIEEKQRNAEDFLASQKNRVGNIEKELLAATGKILPPSKESKTITELAELCRLTQVATREKLEALRLSLANDGYTVTSPKTNLRQGINMTNKASNSSPSVERKANRMRKSRVPSMQSSGLTMGEEKKFLLYDDIGSETSLPLVSNIGGPLESVLEADCETDGMHTPGSYLESPALSSAHRGPFVIVGDEFYDSDVSVTPSGNTKKGKIQNRRTSSSFTLRSPCTPPTLDKLRITSSTNNFLQHMDSVGEDKEDKSLSISSHGSRHDVYSSNHISFSTEASKKPIVQEQFHPQQQQQHLYEFRDEDDMITLDTQSTMTKNNTFSSPIIIGGASNEKRLSVEERSQFFARMEGILERVEETLEESPSPRNCGRIEDKSRHADERQTVPLLFAFGEDGKQPLQHSISSTSSMDKVLAPSDRQPRKTLHEGESFSSDNDEISVMNFSKDSTNVVATQVGGKGTSKDEIMSAVFSDNDSKKQNSLKIFQQRPIHILVDAEVASPAHTNITMDATFMNEANEMSFVRGEENHKKNTNQIVRGMINFDVEEDDDNLSTVTPVLDRYRLDPSDDNSSGVKVVPNKRSLHRSNQKERTTPRQGRLPTIAQLSPSLDYILQATTPKKESNQSDIISPQIMTSERHLRNMTMTTPLNQKRKVYRKTPFPNRKAANMEEDASYSAADENCHPNTSDGSSIPDFPEPFKYNRETFAISVPPLRHSSFETKRTDELALRYRQEETDTIQKIDETIERIDLELASPTRSRIKNIGQNNPLPKTTIEG